MDRREAIKRVGVLMGGALSMSTVAGVLGGCQAGPTDVAFVPQALTSGRDELVATVAELIIPETDTPGARGARVHEFIDRMLSAWYEDEERDHFLAELATVDQKTQDAHGKPFLDLTAAEQTDLLTAMEEESIAWMETLGTGGSDPDKPPFFVAMKGLTLFGYYTSEVGATQELHVMPMGVYRGDVPYEEIGRAWA